MQAELRLSVGEHSFLSTYSGITYEGEQPRKGNLTQLGSGSADTIEMLYYPSQPSPASSHAQNRSDEHQGQGPESREAHEAKIGGVARNLLY